MARNGNNALICAAYNPQVSLEMFKVLVDAGCQVNHTNRVKRNVLLTYLFACANEYDPTVVKYFID